MMTQMLLAYYDQASQGGFDQLFQGTYIYEHCTEMKGAYEVLLLDFSGISTGEDACAAFTKNLVNCIQKFAKRYPQYDFSGFDDKNYANPTQALDEFIGIFVKKADRPIYLLIDEYDHFANELLSKDVDEFRKITSNNGWLKTFYASIKKFIGLDIIERVFMTGVTHISLDSMTSGFNVAVPVSGNVELLNAAGFTAEELRTLIAQTIDPSWLNSSIDEIFSRMKDYYNGYRFDPSAQEGVFNPSMCLYYLYQLQNRHREPRNMLDPAVSMDLSKISGIFSLAEAEDVVQIVNRITMGEAVYPEEGYLPEEANLNLNQKLKLAHDDVLMLLFMMGYLTYREGEDDALVCPNKAVLNQFFCYYFDYLKKVELRFNRSKLPEVVRDLKDGSIVELMRWISETLKAACGQHAAPYFPEINLQIAAAFALLPTSEFSVQIEPEAHGKGFMDLLIRPTDSRSGASAIIVEFKMVKAKAPKAAVDKALQAAKSQAVRYASAFAADEKLKKYAVVFAASEVAAMEEC